MQADGTFGFNSLPEGELEIVALADGFVSTNGPGQAHMRYPQKHRLGTNDLGGVAASGLAVVGRQLIADIEIVGQQVPHSIGVFTPIHAPQRRAARIRMGGDEPGA